MNCQEYQNLSHFSKVEFIGKLVHAVQNDGWCYVLGQALVDYAEETGIFDNVTILPENGKEETTGTANDV